MLKEQRAIASASVLKQLVSNRQSNKLLHTHISFTKDEYRSLQRDLCWLKYVLFGVMFERFYLKVVEITFGNEIVRVHSRTWQADRSKFGCSFRPSMEWTHGDDVTVLGVVLES